MKDNVHLGMGKNPRGKDLPLGLAMELASEPAALDRFTELTQDGRDAIVTYIQSSNTGDDAKMRIRKAIQSLKNGGV